LKLTIIIICLLSFLCLFSNELINAFDGTEELNDQELFQHISQWHDFLVPEETGVFLEAENVISDTLTAPFIYYIPVGYDPKKSHNLLIDIHGGVGRLEFIEDFLENISEDQIFKNLPDNWFILFPMGNVECMWWDKTGMENIKYQILFLKNKFNIDDDRVYITGFSDGGSGSFHFALNSPDYFASFYPLNGMLSVGHVMTQKPVYVQNMMNRYSRVINTDLDTLYPASEMRKVMDLAIGSGADIFYKEYWDIGHEFTYAAEEVPLMYKDMLKHPRNTFRNNIYWETASPGFGKCDWLEIVELDTTSQAEDWHENPNLELKNIRMSFGFYSDQEYTGSGARVTDVVEGSAVDEMGIVTDDIILGMDGILAVDLSHLTYMRDKKKRGDDFSLTILRNSEELVLEGSFPEPEVYQIFDYSTPSGAVRAEYFANQFHLETSRISRLKLYIHPGMVNLAIPVTVYINGEETFNEMIQPNREFVQQNFQENLDRKTLWVNEIEFQIK